MAEWVIKVSAAAAALTAAGYILPKGGLKNAAMLALGFLFLTVLMPPVRSLAEDLMSEKLILEAERDALAHVADEEDITSEIMKSYKERIAGEITASLAKISVSCENVSVTVDELADSETFGYVLAVSCDIYAEEEQSGGSTDRVTVPEIVIDLDGIRVENDADAGSDGKESAFIREMTAKAVNAIAAVTGTDTENIHVKWSDEQ